MIHSSFKLAASSAVLALLGGCASPGLQQIVEASTKAMRPALDAGTPKAMPITGDRLLGSAAMAEELAKQQLAAPVARRATKPWYGARMVAVNSDELLPPVFAERYTFDFDDRNSGGRVPLEVVAERIYRITGVPVRISADVHTRLGPAGASAPAPAMALPAAGSVANRTNAIPLAGAGSFGAGANATANQGADLSRPMLPVTDLSAIEMRWRERDMTSFLNTVTDRLGLGWSYRDGVVMIHRFTSETFELAAFSGHQDFAMTISGSSAGAAGGSGGASGSSASQLQVNESGKMEAVASFVKSLTTMLASVPGSTVTLNEGTARLTVTTTKDAMRQVRSVVRQELESMSRQVMIQIDIYSVSNTISNESGVNMAVLFQNLQKTLGVAFTGPASSVSSQAGGIAMNILSVANGGNPSNALVQKLGDSSLVIQALHQNGMSVQHQPLTMIALNRHWARKTNLRQTGYLSETTPSTVAGAGSGAPGLKTSTITTGDRFIIQPAILDNGGVMLKFGVSLTNLLGLFDVVAGAGPTLQKVQTPEVSGTDDQSTVMLKAGEVMVLTGLSRYKSNRDGRSLAEGVTSMLGGSSKLESIREDFVIFVRPVLL